MNTVDDNVPNVDLDLQVALGFVLKNREPVRVILQTQSRRNITKQMQHHTRLPLLECLRDVLSVS
jgi:hypothetical protein